MGIGRGGYHMNKNKLILGSLIIVIILGGSFFYINANQPNSIDYNSMVQVVNSIENERAKEVVLDLYYAPGYSISTTKEIKDGDKQETESQSEDANNDLNNNEEFKAEIKKLSKLSGTELDKEVKKIVENVLNENINKPNINWDRTFVDKYVKEYCPEYLPLIEEKKKESENSTDDPLYYDRNSEQD